MKGSYYAGIGDRDLNRRKWPRVDLDYSVVPRLLG